MASVDNFFKTIGTYDSTSVAVPAVLGNKVQGGLHSYANSSEMNAILGADNRYGSQYLIDEGMISFNKEDGKYYKLLSSSTATYGYKWEELTFGGGSEEPKFSSAATYFVSSESDVNDLTSEDVVSATTTTSMTHKYNCETTLGDTCYVYFAIPVDADNYDILVNGNLTNAYTKTSEYQNLLIYRLDNKLGGKKITLLVKS